MVFVAASKALRSASPRSSPASLRATSFSCRRRKASNSPAMASSVSMTPSRSSASIALMVGPAPSSKSSSSSSPSPSALASPPASLSDLASGVSSAPAFWPP